MTVPQAAQRDMRPVPGITKGDMITEPRWGLIVVVTGVSIIIRDSSDRRSQWLYLVSWAQHRFQDGLPPVTGVEAMGGADEVRAFPAVSTGPAQAAQAAA
jgi:hypothetical protein